MTRIFAKKPANKAEIIQDIAQATLIFLGERHDNAEDHQGQLQILQALYDQNPRIAIAFEMFQRPYQFALDDYLAGKISEDQLQLQSEFDERWGFDWQDYAPLLRFAQCHQLPLLALNTPTEITRQVATAGLTSLTPADRQWIPPLSEIKTDDVDYRRFLEESYQRHHQSSQGQSFQGNSKGFDRFVEAQILWDETMAEAIAKFAQSHPNYQILVLAGQGHIIYGYGIPSRVRRRLGSVSMRSVFFGDFSSESRGERQPVDYQWLP
jgi:uncharacterized iron-regulated protein